MNTAASVPTSPPARRARGDLRRAQGPRALRPPERPLSAPELCVVREEARGDGREALRMAIVELAVHGVLHFDRRGTSLRSATLQRTPGTAELAAPVAAVAASLGSASMNLRDLEHELSLTWPTPRDYVWTEVVPALCRNGIMELADRPRGLGWLGPKPTLTPRGRAAREELDGRLAVFGGPFDAWVHHDPARAAAFVATAGSAVLLAGTAWHAVRELHARRTPDPGSGATGAWETAVGTSMRLMQPDLDFSILGDGLDGWAHGDGGFGGGGDGAGGGDGGGGGGC